MHLAKLYKTEVKNGYIFCFFGRKGGLSLGNFSSLNCSFNSYEGDFNVVRNRKKINEFLDSKKKIILLNQVHSNKVKYIEKPNQKILTADSMFSCRKDIFLGILTADCAPVIVLGKNFFGIIHAGWRGTLNGIIENTINEMTKKGEKIQDFHIFIGPHLMKKSFEVKHDFLIMEDRKFVDISHTVQRQYKKFANWVDLVTVMGNVNKDVVRALSGVLLVANMSNNSFDCTEHAKHLATQNSENIVGFITQHRIENNTMLCMTPGISMEKKTDKDQNYRHVNDVDTDIIIVGRGIYNDPNYIETAKMYMELKR